MKWRFALKERTKGPTTQHPKKNKAPLQAGSPGAGSTKESILEVRAASAVRSAQRWPPFRRGQRSAKDAEITHRPLPKRRRARSLLAPRQGPCMIHAKSVALTETAPSEWIPGFVAWVGRARICSGKDRPRYLGTFILGCVYFGWEGLCLN